MLIYSRARYYPTGINMLVLKDRDEMFYYIHRSLYEHAVVLNERYKNNIEGLKKVMGKRNNEEACEWFSARAPYPVGILGYYLAFVTEGLEKDMEILCGALHVMSGVLQFDGLLKMDKRLRGNILFSLSVKKEYQLSWDRFFQEALSEEKIEELKLAKMPYGYPLPMPVLEGFPRDLVPELPLEPEPAVEVPPLEDGLSLIRSMRSNSGAC